MQFLFLSLILGYYQLPCSKCIKINVDYLGQINVWSLSYKLLTTTSSQFKTYQTNLVRFPSTYLGIYMVLSHFIKIQYRPWFNKDTEGFARCFPSICIRDRLRGNASPGSACRDAFDNLRRVAGHLRLFLKTEFARVITGKNELGRTQGHKVCLCPFQHIWNSGTAAPPSAR